MDNFKEFWEQYKGIIIGALVTILILCTKLYELIIAIVFIAFGMYAGNYIQKNKVDVKDKLKNFIDKL